MATSHDLGTSRDRLGDQSFNRVLMQIVGPVLIMLMVGSLVFFLIEIFYRGPHTFRLRWVFGLFTAAAVLVSRISIEEGLERAAIFGFALAAATLMVAVSLVDFDYGALFFLEPVVVTLFIGVVMWSANRLTWDCTVIDGSRDVSSIGLAELVQRKLFKRGSQKERQVVQAAKELQPPNDSPKGASRWLFPFFANSKNQNTPGLWVFYFAMAAFPIFGFGQWFAQPGPGWGYRWIFLLFAIYLGSALGLLMLTSLLGLERYLNKRGATLPAAVSRNWLAVGSVFALATMLIMLMLPSPSLSNGWQDALAFLTTNNKNTARHAVGKDGQQEGENARNQKVDENAEGAQQKPGDQGKGQGDKGKGGDSKSQAKGGDSSGDKKSKQQSDSKQQSKSDQSKPGDSKGEKSEQDSSRNDKTQNSQSSDKNKQEDQGADSKNKQDQGKDDAGQSGDEKQAARDEQKAPEDDDERKDDQQKNDAKPANDRQQQPNDQNQQAKKQGARQNANQPQPRSSSQPLSAISKFLGGLMRFVVYGVGLIVLVIVIWMFRDELAKLWAELFGKKDQKEDESVSAETTDKRSDKPLPAFAQFREPFSTGVATKWPASRTIQYSFEALEAWARGHEVPRDPDQTPHEFAKQLAAVNENIAAEAQMLADLHGQSLFSGGDVDRAGVAKLKRLWQLMNTNSPSQREMQLASES